MQEVKHQWKRGRGRKAKKAGNFEVRPPSLSTFNLYLTWFESFYIILNNIFTTSLSCNYLPDH